MKTRRSFFRSCCVTVIGLAAGIGILKPSKSKAVLPCGPICVVLLVAIVLGVAIYITVKALKGCEKLKKDYQRTHPDDDDDTVTPVTPPPGHIPNSQSSPLAVNVPSVDISDLGYTDPDGNVYCTAADVFVQAAGPGESFHDVARIETYISFASAAVMQWSAAQQCYPAIMSGAMQPTGIKTKYYDSANQLVGIQRHTFESGKAQCDCVMVSPMSGPAKNFRTRSVYETAV